MIIQMHKQKNLRNIDAIDHALLIVHIVNFMIVTTFALMRT